MHHNILNDPFDADTSLVDQPHGHSPLPGQAKTEVQRDYEQNQSSDFVGMEHFTDEHHNACDHHEAAPPDTGVRTEEDVLSRVVENTVMRAIFPNDLHRRAFIRRVGRGTAAAIVGSLFPLGTAKSMASDPVKGIEKKDLSIGFIPITCATPIIMAEPHRDSISEARPQRKGSEGGRLGHGPGLVDQRGRRCGSHAESRCRWRRSAWGPARKRFPTTCRPSRT